MIADRFGEMAAENGMMLNYQRSCRSQNHHLATRSLSYPLFSHQDRDHRLP
jgi:hypothetical protein